MLSKEWWEILVGISHITTSHALFLYIVTHIYFIYTPLITFAVKLLLTRQASRRDALVILQSHNYLHKR